MDWILAIDKNKANLATVVAGLFGMVQDAPNSVIPATAVSRDPLTPSSHEEECVAHESKPQWIPVSMGTGMTLVRNRDAAANSGTVLERPKDAACLSETNCPRISRSQNLYLQSILRAAESALRRLILLFIQVHGITARARTKRADACPLPDFASFTRRPDAPPRFNLIDPRKPIVLSWQEDDFTLRQAQGEGNVQLPLHGSRSKCDQHLCHCVRARSADAEQGVNTATGGECLEQASHVSSARFLQRLRALDHALNTLPQQAKRMAREIAKRKTAPPGKGSEGPIRIGKPPGHRDRPRHEIDHILKECHGLVRDIIANPP